MVGFSSEDLPTGTKFRFLRNIALTCLFITNEIGDYHDIWR